MSKKVICKRHKTLISSFSAQLVKLLEAVIAETNWANFRPFSDENLCSYLIKTQKVTNYFSKKLIFLGLGIWYCPAKLVCENTSFEYLYKSCTVVINPLIYYLFWLGEEEESRRNKERQGRENNGERKTDRKRASKYKSTYAFTQGRHTKTLEKRVTICWSVWSSIRLQDIY